MRRGGADRRSPGQARMDTMDRYVMWSEDYYAGIEEYIDTGAIVRTPFMGYSFGDIVEVRIKYIEGKVYVNGKLVKFVIED